MGAGEKLVSQREQWDSSAIALMLFLALLCKYICELEVRTLGITFLALLLSCCMTLAVLSLYLSFPSVKRSR